MAKSKKLTVEANTKLERAVKKWVNWLCTEYGDGAKGVFRDLFQGGCASGMVGDLIYYKDTIPFYKRHKAEIHALLKEMMDGTGLHSPKDLFGNKWDDDDMFAEDTMNQNLLAWFGFEEMARKLADRAGIEI
jgi:hypothetical protein